MGRSAWRTAADVALAAAAVAVAVGARYLAAHELGPLADPRGTADGEARCVCGLDPPLRTGDVLLFSSERLLTRYYLGSAWNHVGIALVAPADDAALGLRAGEPMVCEANLLLDRNQRQALPDRITGERREGAQVVDLRRKVDGYRGRAYVRRLLAPPGAAGAVHARVADGALRLARCGFECSKPYWAWTALHGLRVVPVPPPADLTRPAGDAEPGRAVFCSELAALLLRGAGALRDDVDPGRVLPPHFGSAADPHLLRDGWSLGPEEPLCPCRLRHGFLTSPPPHPAPASTPPPRAIPPRAHAPAAHADAATTMPRPSPNVHNRAPDARPGDAHTAAGTVARRRSAPPTRIAASNNHNHNAARRTATAVSPRDVHPRAGNETTDMRCGSAACARTRHDTAATTDGRARSGR